MRTVPPNIKNEWRDSKNLEDEEERKLEKEATQSQAHPKDTEKVIEKTGTLGCQKTSRVEKV